MSTPSKKKKSSRMCFCQLDTRHLESKETNWDEIFDIPGISDFELRGNDSDESIKSSKVHLLILGKKFESLLSQPEAQLDYPVSIVRLINSFALNGKLDQSCLREQLPDLLQAAKEFNISGLKKLASEKLMATTNDDNVLASYQLAEEFLCSHISNRIEEIILAKIQDFALKPGFLSNCSGSWIGKWLADDRFNADEDKVFVILRSWASLSPENEASFLTLAKQVRFQLMTREFFLETVKPTLVDDKKLIRKAEKSIIFRNVAKNVRAKKLPLEDYLEVTRPLLSKHDGQEVEKAIKNFPSGSRLPNELVFAVGGIGGDGLGNVLSTVEVFDIRSETWHLAESLSLPSPRAYCRLVVNQDKLFTFGGYGPGMVALDIKNYQCNLSTNVWIEIPRELSGKRTGANVVELDGQVFVIGGEERLEMADDDDDVEMNDDDDFVEMNDDDDFVELNDDDDFVELNDGFHNLASVVKYCIETQTWTQSEPMPVARRFSGAVTFDGKIFVIGGLGDHHADLARTDIYDPDQKIWNQGPDLNVARSAHQVRAIINVS